MTPTLERLGRRVVPAWPVISRRRWLIWPLDAVDWLVRQPMPEFRRLPPARMRLRVGVGNRLLFNHAMFLRDPTNFWFDVLNNRLATLGSNVLDLGCGCGRTALPLRDFEYFGRRFRGQYTGVDVDAEMLAWCRANFPAHRFRFLEVGRSGDLPSDSRVYAGDERGPSRLDVADASQDFVLSNSLFTHLLEADTRRYFQEAARVLRPGGQFHLSVFFKDGAAGARGGRWRFEHRLGEAWVESRRYPEAAVAYERATVEAWLHEAGFHRLRTLPSGRQSVIRCAKR